MPTPRTKPITKSTVKTTAKPVVKSAPVPTPKPTVRSSAPKPAVMVPDRRVKRTAYTKMANALNNIGKKR